MLGPGQIVRLRREVEQNYNLSHFEGLHIARRPIRFYSADEISVIFAEPAVAGKMYPPSRIFGEPIERSCLQGIHSGTVGLPPTIMLELRHAAIIGHTSVLDWQSRLFIPDYVNSVETLSTARRLIDHNHHGILLMGTEQTSEVRYVCRQSVKHINLRVAFLHNLEPGNYGSFLIRQLPQLSLLAHCGVDVDAYVVPDRTPWLREALDMFGLPSVPVFTVREVCGDIFDTVVMASSLDAEGFMGNTPRERLLSQISRRIDTSVNATPRKLYVSRNLSGIARPDYRPLLNEAEIEQIVTNYGFAITYPETLSLAAQIALFANADVIVGPSGSGMINAMFCMKGQTILDVESWTPNVRQHAKVYSSSGLSYSFAFGDVLGISNQSPQVSPWRIDADLFTEALDWTIEDSTPSPSRSPVNV